MTPRSAVRERGADVGPDADVATFVRRHLSAGWRALAVFATIGVALETMHAFKVGWYVDAGSETRRLVLTLAHAHGVLLGLVNVAFAWTLERRVLSAARRRAASACLLAATIALPGGFLLGALFAHGGDPGLGIALVPPGAGLLLAALAVIAW